MISAGAALAALAVPAAALSATVDTGDPIFGLIEAERAARKALHRCYADAPKGCDPADDILIPLYDAACDAVDAVLKGRPASIPGVIAVMDWAIEAEADDVPIPDDWYRDFIRATAATLKRIAVAGEGTVS